MNFNEAFKAMKDGKKVKLPSWGGYWSWDEEKQTIMIHCRPQDSDANTDIIDIRQTERVEYTTLNICSDEWVLADETNTTILGGTPQFNFGEAIKYMKRGMTVARKGWNGKGMYLFLITGTDLQNGLKMCFGEYENEPTLVSSIAMKTAQNTVVVGWLASQADMLAEDWVFAE